MVAGYPGRTSRYALASEFDQTAQWSYPAVVEHYGNQIALVEAAGAKDEDIKVKYASTVKGWHNVVKNYDRSEEHTSELQSLMRISYAVFCLKKKKNHPLSPHTNSKTTRII